MDVKELASSLNLSERKVRHALARFKIYNGRQQYIPDERLKKAVEILEENFDIPEVVNAFLEGINFCPRWIPSESIEILQDIPDELLTPENRLYTLTLTLLDEEVVRKEGYEKFLMEIGTLRKSLYVRGLKFSYMMALIPFLLVASHTMTTYPLDEALELERYVKYFPPLYRNLYEEVMDAVKALRRKTFLSELIEEAEKEGRLDPDLEFLKLYQSGKFEEAARIVIDFDEIPEPLRTLLKTVQYIALLYSSPVEPPPPPFEKSEEDLLAEMHRASAKAVYLRLKGEDYRAVIAEEDPYIAKVLSRFYFEPDIPYIRRYYNWFLAELIIKIHRGEVDRAWEIAKESLLLGDFFTIYILMGKPIYLLPYRYRLRIPWIPARVRIQDDRLRIFYMDGEMEFRGRVVELMEEIIRGNGLLRKSDFRYLKKRLWFLRFKVKDGRYPHMVEVRLDEELL